MIRNFGIAATSILLISAARCNLADASEWVENAEDKQIEDLHSTDVPPSIGNAPNTNADADAELTKYAPYLAPAESGVSQPPSNPAASAPALTKPNLPTPNWHPLRKIKQDVAPAGNMIKQTGRTIFSPTGLAVGAAAGIGIWALADKNMFLRKWAGGGSANHAYGSPYYPGTTYGTGAPIYYQGYTTRNGTYVPPHWQTAPDGTMINNYSTIGNTNPFTGRSGWIYPAF